MGNGRDIEYFEWLCKQINSLREPYYFLLRQLYSKEFYALIPNDDNRGEDGKEFRKLYALQKGIADISGTIYEGPCTVLEMLVAIANRLGLILEDSGEEEDRSRWFFRLLDHLGLLDFTDDNYIENSDSATLIDEILNRLIDRTYSADGYGGLFPLRNPDRDQREVEIWYQMQAWLNENCAV